MIQAHDAEHGPAFELYGLGLEHKHVPETQLYGGLSRRPIFVPSVGHYLKGMLVSIPLHLDTLPGKPTGADLHAVLAARYAGCDLVRVIAPPADGKLEPEALNDTDRLELMVHVNETYRQAVLVARLDNLGKGASGAAVQNIALMLGLRTGVGAQELADA
jgi:N-acetyl-gamma-glutamyl-phosphate reductase